MAEPDLNVDSLIQRLLEGNYYMFVLFCRHSFTVKSLSKTGPNDTAGRRHYNRICLHLSNPLDLVG